MYSQKDFEHINTVERATSIAHWLINYYEIQTGYGLSQFLGINPARHNYDAIRIWVQLQISILPKRYHTLGELRKAFESLLPI